MNTRTPRPWASPYLIQRKTNIGRLHLAFEARSAKGWMGRFGGGWDWKLGLQASTPSAYGWTIIVSLLVAEISVSWHGPAMVATKTERTA